MGNAWNGVIWNDGCRNDADGLGNVVAVTGRERGLLPAGWDRGVGSGRNGNNSGRWVLSDCFQCHVPSGRFTIGVDCHGTAPNGLYRVIKSLTPSG